MKISTNIINKNQYYTVSKKRENASNCNASKNEYNQIPSFSSNYYLSFKGGDSLNLGQTMRNFYEAEILNDEQIVPNRIKKAANFVIEAGNPKKLTLVDIHKHVYEDILYCDSLDEVKEKYPEFKDVLSMDEVETRSDSFISDVKNGKCKIFTPDEDLSLQLLKLYWAEAYSLNDLKNYANGQRQLAPVLVKLNIPRVHRQYGQILKLSEPEYNERFVETLKLKQMENFEKNNGHIYIPRGVVSAEEGMKICEALIDYYAENPGRIYLQSTRLKEFYKNNHEAASFLKEVLYDAWRLGSSKNVKSSMQNYFRAKHFVPPSEKELADVKNLGSKKRLILQDFWDNTPTARKHFGKSLKSALNRLIKIKRAQKETLVLDNALPAYPKKISDKIKQWVELSGYDPDIVVLNLSLSLSEANQKLMNKSMGARLVSEYFNKNPLMSDVYADSLSYAISELKQYLAYNRTQNGDAAIRKIENAARGKTFMYTNELISLYLDLINFFIKTNNITGTAKLVSAFENSYDKVILMRQQSGLPIPD